VKTGRLSKELSAIFRRAFDKRCDADYDDLIELRQDELSEILEQARHFVTEVKSHLKEI